MRARLVVLVVAIATASVAAGVVLRTRDDGTTRSDFCDPPAEVAPANDVREAATETAVGFEPHGRVALALAVADVGDGRLLVAAKDGGLWQVSETGATERILDLSAEVATDVEQGLLGVAVAPDAAHVYVSATLQDATAVILEYAVSEAGLDPATRRTVLSLDDPHPSHNGGRLAFDDDGMLLLGIGDGGNGDRTGAAEDLGSPFGKMLRIDPRPTSDRGYGIPPDNPFVGTPGAREEIWAFGFRNPWGWSIDRATGDLWVADVGQLCFEEIDQAPDAGRGENFGWSHLEGRHEFLGPVLQRGGEPEADVEPADLGERPGDLVDPVLEYPHTPEGCSVIGGHVYRGAAIPDLRGAYVWADLCQRAIFTLRADGDGWERGRLAGDIPAGIVAFGEDRAGVVYAISLDTGPVRLVPPG